MKTAWVLWSLDDSLYLIHLPDDSHNLIFLTHHLPPSAAYVFLNITISGPADPKYSEKWYLETHLLIAALIKFV